MWISARLLQLPRAQDRSQTGFYAETILQGIEFLNMSAGSNNGSVGISRRPMRARTRSSSACSLHHRIVISTSRYLPDKRRRQIAPQRESAPKLQAHLADVV